MEDELNNTNIPQAGPTPGPRPPRLSPFRDERLIARSEAIGHEARLSFLCVALIGVAEMIDSVADDELRRRVNGSLGRALDLLQQARREVEALDEVEP